MNRIIVAAAAALTLSACSEATAPVSSADLAVSYGKKAPTSTTVVGNLTNANYNFDAQATLAAAGSTGGTVISTEVFEGVASASPISPVAIYNSLSNYFVGRFENTKTAVQLRVPQGGSKYSLQLDVYAIGSWDGIGKQAQNGVFEANVFQVGAICASAPGTVIDIFSTTFSNQMTVQQNYPLSFSSGGGSKALTGSLNSDVNFKNDPTVNVPSFRSVSDATYRLSFSSTNPCGSGEVKFIFRSYGPGQQSAPDETWGVDNITIKTDA